jgi:hypothetical protein
MRTRRHIPPAISKGDDLSSFTAYLREGAADPTIVIGPILWQPSDGRFARDWYFFIATCGPDGFQCDKVSASGDKAICEEMRDTVLFMLTQSKPPTVIHDTDDELYMTKICEALWPGERITRLRKAVEAEYADRAKAGEHAQGGYGGYG